MLKETASIFRIIFLLCLLPIEVMANDQASLCLDGFCIGQSISNERFDKVEWMIPQNKVAWTIPAGMIKEACNGVGCQPEIAFRGYAKEYQAKIANAVSWIYSSSPPYNIITKDNLKIFRQYKYECNPSARGIFGERRFFGAYRSIPSQYLTVVGLRLINGDLKVYRIVREYPIHTPDELVSLARKLHLEYGEKVLFYNYLSSNAYSDVIQQNKDGWFARSSMFTPNDLSNNTAELVLVDPSTRSLLQPSSMPESGEIKPLAVTLSTHCNRSMPIQ